MGELLQPSHLLILFFALPVSIVALIPGFWFVCKKAGFSPLVSLLNLVPFGLGTLALVYLLAFGHWKSAGAPQVLRQARS